MIIRLTTAIAATLLILNWDQRRRAREQKEQQSRAKPTEVTTWEGEGGALPKVGAQPGPAPLQS
jgi:hypothetical protein